MMDPASTAASDAFVEFDRLVCAVAGDASTSRVDAAHWSDCRAALLASDYRDYLPGFVRQCGSVSKYREFISLYDADPRRRLAFVETEMEPARDHHADRTAMRIGDADRGVRPSTDWTF